jgi:hypothetical protein
MGFRFHKSIKAGPVQINLSKSGIGASTGVKGARVGVGPRGAYVAGGKDGVYFRGKIGGEAGKTEAPTIDASKEEQNHSGIFLLLGIVIFLAIIIFIINII